MSGPKYRNPCNTVDLKSIQQHDEYVRAKGLDKIFSLLITDALLHPNEANGAFCPAYHFLTNLIPDTWQQISRNASKRWSLSSLQSASQPRTAPAPIPPTSTARYKSPSMSASNGPGSLGMAHRNPEAGQPPHRSPDPDLLATLQRRQRLRPRRSRRPPRSCTYRRSGTACAGATTSRFGTATVDAC